MGDDNRWPKVYPGRMGIWSRGRGNETSDVLNKKLLRAFNNVKSFPLKRIIIQFWRPVKTTAGVRVLSCSGNPFAASFVNHRVWKYRSRCSKYYYTIDDDLGVVDDPMTISGAPPSSAILNHFPEVVLDLRVHRGTPLVDLALECELTCFMMLPVWQLHESSCVGVIEVSMRLPRHLVVIFNELQRELKRVGLSITPPQALRRPCKAIAGDLELAKSEVGKALQMAIESHAITLGHVWIPYENYRGRIQQKFLGKLKTTSSGVDDSDGGDHQSLVNRFYYDLVYLPLKKGEGLVGRTLETRQPHLCRNIYKLSDNRGILAALSAANTKCTCFVICLRSSHTGELDYAFEFFWPQSRNYLALMEALLLTLREYLPSFKHASGAQLGDDLLVLDVDNLSSPVKIFPSETRGMKRKSIEGQSNSLEGEDDDDDDLTIVAVYKVDCRLFFLPSSPTFKYFMEKIKQEFELNPAGTYKIEYQVLPGEWYSLTNGACLKSCISSYRTSTNIDHIKVCVQALAK